MWNRKGVLGAIVVGILVAGGVVVAGGVTTTEVQGLITSVEVAAAGNEWVDTQGVMHGRAGRTVETLEGDMEGTLYVLGNYDLDLNPLSADFGYGKMWGTLEFEGTVGADGVSRELVGIWSGEIDFFYLNANWSMYGTGVSAGGKLTIDNYGPLTPPGQPYIPQAYEGYWYSK